MSQLMSKFTIGGQELKNRIVLAPMTRARCTPVDDPLSLEAGLANEVMATYYEQRSSGGLIVTEATAISKEGHGWKFAPKCYLPEHVEAWKKVVDRVHAKGGVIYLQLWHLGRQGHSSFHPKMKRIVAPSAIAMNKELFKAKTLEGNDAEPEVPHALTLDEIKGTIQDYVKSARCAKEAGFDGVEIHAANGYLIDLFLQSRTNTRTDEYGGSPENRVRFLKEVFEGIVADGSYPAERIGFRISPNGVFGDMGSEDNDVMFPFVAKTMNEYKPAYMHVMDGLGFGWHDRCKVVTATDLRKNFDGPIMCNIGLTKDVAEGMIRSGACDMAVFGRLYMSNPDLPERFANDWPLTPAATYETWWQPTGAKGYTDWPFYKPEEEKESA